MKKLSIILGVLLILFLSTQLMSYQASNNVEMYSYEVKATYGDVEIREYESALFTKTELGNASFKQQSSGGFRILAGYIFGDNEDSTEIAMTSPVVMSLDKNKSMMFMVPSNWKQEDLPKPNNQNIEFVEMPKMKMAAITFPGYANDEKINQHQSLLDSTLKANNIQHKGNFSYFGYNPPYQMFDRRNEVVVEIID